INVSQKKIKKYLGGNRKIIPFFPGGQHEISSLLNFLGTKGISSLLVEEGANINASFAKEGAFNQMITYISPKIISGALAPGPFGGDGINTMNK
ncbi:dihydrofolate reductase family protein, partial [Bacillus pseudomycoides]|uniref:dihydrofolate reductase family protein n=1 Tax=Bacillus pseudomycoides TaxID=64104 RepID=UPI0015D47E89